MKLFIYIAGIVLLTITAVIISMTFSETTPKTIRLGYSIQEAIGNSPLIVAKEKGFFSDEGINVEMVPLKNGGEIAQALSSGSLDMGAVGMTNLLVPVSKGAPIKVIAPLALFPVDFFTRPGEINTFKDLLGKRIASRPGGNADFVVRHFLKQENIDLTKIEFVDIDRAFRPIALMERNIIDAAAAVSYDTTAFTNSGAVIMKEWEQKGYSTVTSPSSAVATNIAVNTNYLKANDSLVEKFLEAYIKGHEYIQENQNDCASVVEKHVTLKSDGAFTYTTGDILRLWNKQKNMYQLWYEPETMIELFDAAKEMLVIERIPSVDEFYDQRFKTQLVTKHRELYE